MYNKYLWGETFFRFNFCYCKTLHLLTLYGEYAAPCAGFVFLLFPFEKKLNKN